jgi:hypothetical protein
MERRLMTVARARESSVKLYALRAASGFGSAQARDLSRGLGGDS